MFCLLVPLSFILPTRLPLDFFLFCFVLLIHLDSWSCAYLFCTSICNEKDLLAWVPAATRWRETGPFVTLQAVPPTPRNHQSFDSFLAEHAYCSSLCASSLLDWNSPWQPERLQPNHATLLDPGSLTHEDEMIPILPLAFVGFLWRLNEIMLTKCMENEV